MTSLRHHQPPKRPNLGRNKDTLYGLIVFPQNDEYPTCRPTLQEPMPPCFISRPHDEIPMNWGSQIPSGTTTNFTQASPAITLSVQGNTPTPPSPQQILADPTYAVFAVRKGILLQSQVFYPNPKGFYSQYQVACGLGDTSGPEYNFKLACGGLSQVYTPMLCIDSFPSDYPSGALYAHPHRLRYWPLVGKTESREHFIKIQGCKSAANQKALVWQFLLRDPSTGNTVAALGASQTANGRVAVYKYSGGRKILMLSADITGSPAQTTANVFGYQVTDTGRYNLEFLISNSPTGQADGVGTQYNQLVAQVFVCSATGNCPAGTPGPKQGGGGLTAGSVIWPAGSTYGGNIAAASNTGGACQEVSQLEAFELSLLQPFIDQAASLTVCADYWSSADTDHNGGTIVTFQTAPNQNPDPFIEGLATNGSQQRNFTCWHNKFGVSILAPLGDNADKAFNLVTPFVLDDTTAQSDWELIDADYGWTIAFLIANSGQAANGNLQIFTALAVVTHFTLWPSQKANYNAVETRKQITHAAAFPSALPSVEAIDPALTVLMQ